MIVIPFLHTTLAQLNPMIPINATERDGHQGLYGQFVPYTTLVAEVGIDRALDNPEVARLIGRLAVLL